MANFLGNIRYVAWAGIAAAILLLFTYATVGQGRALTDPNVLQAFLRWSHVLVGIMWIGLNRAGIGIHGTNQPQTIGRSASHGCMRTANWDVIRLSKMITKGLPVIIEGPKPTPRPVVVAAKKTPATPASKLAATPTSEKKWFQFWKKK
jgi:hypothetical protein